MFRDRKSVDCLPRSPSRAFDRNAELARRSSAGEESQFEFPGREGDRAVLEIGGREVALPLDALPDGVREGDVLEFAIAPAVGRDEADEEVAARRARLARGDPGGDVEL